MTPNFALSLSFDGIRLLQQVPDGWNLVGEVPLEVDDLAAELAELRRMALQLAPDGLRTKLVIPPDQIRFMTLDTAQTSLDDVKHALEGQTPYKLDELVIDFDRHGGRTYIAAVARETLSEAEAFAVEHNFAPVAFVAVPEPDTFDSEVFFGPTRAVGRTEVSRDSRPVVQTGVVKPTVPDAPAPTAAKVDTAVPSPQSDASAGSAPNPGTEPVFASRTRPAGRTDAAQVLTATPPPSAPVGAGAPDGTKTPVADMTPSPSKAPALIGVGLAGGPVAPAKRPAVSLDTIKTAPVEPLFTRRKEPPPPAPANLRAASPDSAGADTPATLTPAAIAAAMPVAAPAAAQRKPLSDPLGTVQAPRGKPRFLGLILTVILLLTLLLIGLWASTLPTDGIASWFRGGNDTVQTAATETSVVPDAPVAEAVAEPVGDIPTVPVEDVAPETALLPETDPVAPEPDSVENAALSPQVLAEPGQPVVRAPAGRVLSPAEADRIYAATGVYQRAPRLNLTPRTSTLESLDPVTLLPTPAALPRPAMPVLDAVAPDAALSAPVNPPRADAVFERDANGNILATPDGTLMPDGAIVFAGAPDLRPVARPRSTRPVDTGAADATAPALPSVMPRLRPADLVAAPPPAVTDPAAPQTDGMIAPLDTVTVTTGPPPLRPVLRPLAFADLVPPATADAPDLSAGAVTLDGIRPLPRPDAVATDTPLPAYTGLRPVTRPDSLAPQAVAEAETSAEPEPEPEVAPVTDINAVAAAIAMAAPPSAFANRTQLAVSVTPRPDSRPRNFAQVVASARTTQPPIAASGGTVRTAAAAVETPAPPTIVAPSGNVPGGVARAATQEDAINLRQMNLVGVYGKPNQRRALVRLGNGRYVKVEVGSNLDGGRVTAIGDSALNFVKRGRTYALVLPAG